jgi:hypothetical protein
MTKQKPTGEEQGVRLQLSKTTHAWLADQADEVEGMGSISEKIDAAKMRADGGVTIEVDDGELRFCARLAVENDLSKPAQSLGRLIEKAQVAAGETPDLSRLLASEEVGAAPSEAAAPPPSSSPEEQENVMAEGEASTDVVEPTEAELEALAAAKERGDFVEDPSGTSTRKPRVELGPEIDFERFVADTPEGQMVWFIGRNGMAHVTGCGALRNGPTDAMRINRGPVDDVDLDNPWHRGEKGERGLAVTSHCQCIWRPVQRVLDRTESQAS